MMEYLTQLGNEDHRHALVFRIYSSDGAYVTKDDVLAVLQKTTSRSLSAGQLHEVVAAAVDTYDADQDGRLSPAEFRRLVSAASNELSL
jgi:Ca2+-binding EF-hand superfamily protein